MCPLGWHHPKPLNLELGPRGAPHPDMGHPWGEGVGPGSLVLVPWPGHRGEGPQEKVTGKGHLRGLDGRGPGDIFQRRGDPGRLSSIIISLRVAEGPRCHHPFTCEATAVSSMFFPFLTCPSRGLREGASQGRTRRCQEFWGRGQISLQLPRHRAGS